MTPSLSSWLPRTTSKPRAHTIRNIYAEIQTKHHQKQARKDVLANLAFLAVFIESFLLIVIA